MSIELKRKQTMEKNLFPITRKNIKKKENMKNKRLRNKIYIAFWIAYIAAVTVLTPIMIDIAYSQRGYKAIGGECFPPLTIPVAAAFIYELYKGEPDNEQKKKRN